MPGIAKNKLSLMALALAAATCLGSQKSAFAITPVLTSGNSSLTFDVPSSTASWIVDGVDQFGGSPAGNDTLSYYNGTDFVPIVSLPVTSSSVAGNIGSATFSTTLDGDNFTITIKAILTGGATGSGASGINETIAVNNLGPSQTPSIQPAIATVGGPVDFIVQDDFDANVNATPANDTLTFSPAGAVNTATQTDPTGVKLTYVTTPTPTGVDGSPDSGASTTPMTGNEAFIFTWGLSLAPDDTGIISNTITLSGPGTPPVQGVPLPNSAAATLATLGGLGIITVLRRKWANML